MLWILPLAAVVVALLLLVIAIPKKDRTPAAPQWQPAPAYNAPAAETYVDRRTLRQRQIDEDAALLSAEFARFEDERYRSEVRDRAARAFTPPAVPALGSAPRPAGVANAPTA